MNMVEHNKKLMQGFKRHFGNRQVSLYHAPGRTELGGNHTDHQNGQVLAAAVDLQVSAAVSPVSVQATVELGGMTTEDSGGMSTDGVGIIEIYSEGFGMIEIDITDLAPLEDEVGTTAALVRGVLAGLKDQGFKVGGFKAYITSDVPPGSGLSSSAAFEVLIGRIQSELYNDGSVSPVELARIGRFAENEYFGKPCGLMDQMASAFGGIIYIDFAYDDCPIIEEIDFDFDKCGYKLCITNTGGSHADLTDEYAAVPAEMMAVAELFGQEKLRGITTEQILEKATDIRAKAGDRALLRALHFAGETERAKAQAEALKDGDFGELLRLVKESGDSSYKLLQNVYVSGAAGQQPIAAGLAVSEAVLGEDGVCRVHGGGFAGTIQAFVKVDATDRYKAAMDKLFGDGACKVLRIGRDNVSTDDKECR